MAAWVRSRRSSWSRMRPMGLHRLLGDHQVLGNLGVGAPRAIRVSTSVSRSVSGPTLSRSGARGAPSRAKVFSSRRVTEGQQRVAGRPPPAPPRPGPGRRRPWHEPAGPGPQRLDASSRSKVVTPTSTWPAGGPGGELPGRLQFVQHRHAHVHDDHVGSELRGLVDRLLAVGRLPGRPRRRAGRRAAPENSSRTIAWSSAISTRTLTCPPVRSAAGRRSPPRRRRAPARRSARRRAWPPAPACPARRGRPPGSGRARPRRAVDDLQQQLAWPVAERHPHGGARAADGVERLLERCGRRTAPSRPAAVPAPVTSTATVAPAASALPTSSSSRSRVGLGRVVLGGLVGLQHPRPPAAAPATPRWPWPGWRRSSGPAPRGPPGPGRARPLPGWR